jgi:phospho-N-acetylmuramoyl-pentapeptide-transferase
VTQYALVAIPFLIALTVVLAAGNKVIALLASRKAKQPISPDAPEKHRLKHGTPTMGGLLILAAVLVSVFIMVGWLSGIGALVTDKTNRLLSVLTVFLFAGVIGVMDDVGKARKKENKAGLSERMKLAFQLVVAGGFVLYLILSPHIQDGRNLVTTIWFAGKGIDIGWFYYLFAALFITLFANAANFTDGLDGLLSGTTLIACVTMGALVGASSLEMGIFYGALAGACAGFLWFNSYPARAFMGDTGSLAIGMGLAAAALAAKQEALLIVVGLVYMAEIVSMMLQRYVFKYRRIKRGLEYAQKNRVFRRAPLHHHFEELGWHETQVVGRFYVAALAAAALALIIAPLLMPPLPGFTPPLGGTP